jgi:predicted nucleic acid-binding Zn ribbon protein
MERMSHNTAQEPAALGEVLSRLFALRGYGRPQAQRQLHEAWNRAAGAELAPQTRVLVLKQGVLHVGVANSALLSELTAFRKPELLEGLQAAAPQLRVRDIKFKLRGDLS